jgi:hypothetical protein
MGKFLGSALLAALLAGCQTAPSKTPPPVPSMADPDIEEAVGDLEVSKSDYEQCLRAQEDDRLLDCETSKEMYEEDQAAYELLLKKKKVGP